MAEASDDELFGSLAQFAAEASSAEGVPETISEIVSYGLKVLGADCGGITLWRRRGRLETVGASRQVVIDADVRQYELSEGPCVEAARKESELVAADLATDPRWPQWGPYAAGLGLHSIISAQLSSRDRRYGAINFYAADRRQFTEENTEAVRYFAAHAAAALAAAITEENLRSAVEARTITGAAVGILMERYRLDYDHAFEVLRRYSQDGNIPLRELSDQLINGGNLPKLPEQAKRQPMEPPVR